MRNKRSDIWKHIFKHWNALTILKLNYIMQKKKKIINHKADHGSLGDKTLGR